MAFAQAYASTRERLKSRLLSLLQIILLGILALPLLQMLGRWAPVSSRGGLLGQGAGGEHQEQYHGLVFVSHHKTGTFLVGTIAAGIARFLDVNCLHSIVTVYVNENLTAPAMGHYLDLSKAAAFERFGSVQPPYLILKTGNSPAEACYDTGYMAAEALTIRQRRTHGSSPGKVCPGLSGPTDPTTCPCHNGVSDCMTLGKCTMTMPHARLFYVHMIRHPIDIVVSGYAYHTRDPPAEKWLLEVNMVTFSDFLIRFGIPRELLAELGAPVKREGTIPPPSYWHFLRSLPEKKGIILEFVRAQVDLWRMARLYDRLTAPQAEGSLWGAAVVRFEEMSVDPMKAITPVINAVRSPCLSGKLEEELKAHIVKTCHVQGWSKEKKASHGHIGKYSSEQKARQHRILLSHPYVLKEVRRLEKILDYEPRMGKGEEGGIAEHDNIKTSRRAGKVF